VFGGGDGGAKRRAVFRVGMVQVSCRLRAKKEEEGAEELRVSTEARVGRMRERKRRVEIWLHGTRF